MLQCDGGAPQRKKTARVGMLGKPLSTTRRKVKLSHKSLPFSLFFANDVSVKATS
jgi:hypothetical protein